ncbi:MAG: 50S ribosomal protein L20 [Candidatus Nealsonbacteria bacterium]|nr:50S ribosomal protein L20 [Candidatus Nealsonbacteria bacterium]
MVRVKRGKAKRNRKKKTIKEAKGYKWGRKSKYRLAKDALRHAWTHAYVDRRKKKRDFRRLWQTQISAACKQRGLSYSKFMHGIKESGIRLNRKMLAALAQDQPEVFDEIVEKAKAKLK